MAKLLSRRLADQPKLMDLMCDQEDFSTSEFETKCMAAPAPAPCQSQTDLNTTCTDCLGGVCEDFPEYHKHTVELEEECASFTTSATCSAELKCDWKVQDHGDTCEADGMYNSYLTLPDGCAYKAFFLKTATCAKHQTKTLCEADDNCKWESAEDSDDGEASCNINEKAQALAFLTECNDENKALAEMWEVMGLCDTGATESACEALTLSGTVTCGDDDDDDGGATAGAYSPPTMTLVAFAANVLLMSI